MRLFGMDRSADFNPQGLSDQSFKGRGLTRGRPELELRVAARPHLQQSVLAAIVQLDPREALRVAAVQIFGQPQNRGERPNRPAPLAGQVSVFVVVVLGRPTPM